MQPLAHHLPRLLQNDLLHLKGHFTPLRNASVCIVFAAVPPVISQLTAKLSKLSLVGQWPSSHRVARANMPCSPPMANSSVLPGPEALPAPLATHAPISMAAVSAVSPTTVLAAASLLPDLRRVVTPLDPD